VGRGKYISNSLLIAKRNTKLVPSFAIVIFVHLMSN
jgi:hypothetical protein